MPTTLPRLPVVRPEADSPHRSAGAWGSSFVRWIGLGLVVGLAMWLGGQGRRAYAQEANGEAAATGSMTIFLFGGQGERVVGDLIDSPAGDVLRWQSPLFHEPLEFATSKVSEIRRNGSPESRRPQAPQTLELGPGEVLPGRLTALSATEVTAELENFGQVRIRPDALRRIGTADGDSGIAFIGPGFAREWKQTVAGKPATSGWVDAENAVTSTTTQASISRDIGLSAQARVELVLAWSGNQPPKFVLSLGEEKAEGESDGTVRLEVWNNDLVAIYERLGEVDFAVIEPQLKPNGRIALQVLFNQTQRQAWLVSMAGVPLGTLDLSSADVQPEKADVYGKFMVVTNYGEKLRLESVRSARWNGALPTKGEADQVVVRMNDGTLAVGTRVVFDPGTKEFVLQSPSGERRVPMTGMQDLLLQSNTNSDWKPPLIASFRNGSRIGGELVRVAEGHFYLRHPGLIDLLRCPIAELTSLSARTIPGESPAGGPSAAPTTVLGILEAGETRLQGRLVAPPRFAPSPLVFAPTQANNAVALRATASGKLMYREAVGGSANAAPAQPPVAVAAAVPVPAPANNVLNGVMQLLGADRAKRPPRRKAPAAGEQTSLLHLRVGDVLPCRVLAIDEQGVRFESRVSALNFIPNNQIKVLELATDAKPVLITKTKKERLLTLPRMQRNNAPTHLVRSLNGDYIRGRLVAMNEQELTLELHLETRKLPVDRVARIIWLHADELPGTAVPVPIPANGEAPSSGVRVQVVRLDGNRLTFDAEQVVDTTLSGSSHALGNVKVDTTELDRIVFGAAIDAEASALPFRQWKLHPALDPLDALGEAPSDAAPEEGRDAALVGKPAPDFELDLLEGGRFKLSEQRGKVVVLDFWASWCGPCLRATPMIHRVVDEFGPDVRLVAVNLQESPERVTAALKRLNLEMVTVLDREGLVAERYGATSIPQAVVIDRQGQVARVYVGASGTLEDQLRTALKALAPAAPAP